MSKHLSKCSITLTPPPPPRVPSRWLYRHKEGRMITHALTHRGSDENPRVYLLETIGLPVAVTQWKALKYRRLFAVWAKASQKNLHWSVHSTVLTVVLLSGGSVHVTKNAHRNVYWKLSISIPIGCYKTAFSSISIKCLNLDAICFGDLTKNKFLANFSCFPLR